MSRTLPLLSARNLDAPIAWRNGLPINARQFLADAASHAQVLPSHGAVVNLCRDRYHFAVGLAAALMRGLTSLFPPNTMPETLARLHVQHGCICGVSDDPAMAIDGLPLVSLTTTTATAADAPPMPALDEAFEAACLLTSGSTGTPQPHVKAWGPLVRNVRAAAERLAQTMQRGSLCGLNIVATVPPQHMYGFESSVLLSLLGGAAFDAGRPFFPADIVQALHRLPRPRALVTTPFHLKTLLAAGLPMPATDLVLCATAPLSPQLAQQAERAFSGPLVEIYGCTEAGQVASRRTAHADLWHTFGELRIVAEPGPDGDRFIVQGGHVVQPTPLADVLQLKGESHFSLLGRANDLIHVAGKRSSLSHLNYHLNSIEGVLDGAFWLPPDVTDGVVRTVAFVVAPELDAPHILTALRQRIEPAFLPRRVVHVPELPREATGKLTERSLRALAQAHAPMAALTVTKTIPADHPAFAGHFPGQPLLPGVCLLAEVMEAARREPVLACQLERGTLAAAKFLSPVRPGSTIDIALQWDESSLRFEVRCANTVAARGQWAWHKQ